MITEIQQKESILSFRSTGIMYYEVPVNHRRNVLRSSAFQQNAIKLQKRERYVGFVTDGIKKRMKKCITLLLQSTPTTWKQHPITNKMVQHSISFITLTTPDTDNSRDAKFCHKFLLQPMLRILRNRYQMKSYIWKCELQANGQIHYHVTCDVFTNHSNVKNEWNALLRYNGMLNEFKDKYGHDNPNSTDIHAVNKVKNLEAYLVKYITKEYQNEEKLTGKVWDASKNLKKADYFKIHLSTPVHQFIRDLQGSLMVFTSYFEKAIFLDFKTSDYYSFFSSNIIQQFSKFLFKVREGINLKPWLNKDNGVNRMLLPISTTQSVKSSSIRRQCQLELIPRISTLHTNLCPT